MRRLIRTNNLFVLISLSLSLSGCSRSPSPVQTSTSSESKKIQLTVGQASSNWKVRVIDVSDPDTVKLQSQLSTRDEKPDQNKKWLLLTLELTPPSANAKLPIKQIKLTDESAGTQTPLALTAKPESEGPQFTYFEESFGRDMLGQSRAGQGSVDREGKMVWMYTQDAKTNDVVLTVMKDEPQNILFLFAVPAAAINFRLTL